MRCGASKVDDHLPCAAGTAAQGLGSRNPAPAPTTVSPPLQVRSVTLRFQRPRLLVAMDFLLAVGEFFVPSLAALAGKWSTGRQQGEH